MKCRQRFKTRYHFRKLLESTIIHGSDDRPFAKVKVFDDILIGLFDSVLGKNCLSFEGKHKFYFRNLKIKKFKNLRM